jgi:hypothetical protein
MTQTRRRRLAKGTDDGVPATRIPRALERVDAGPKGGPAAQHGPRDIERIGTTAAPHSNIHLQSGSGVRAKTAGIVGLYLKPPENALVLCVDEKPGIQALDRTQPLLPMRAKKPQSWTNEYVRHELRR